MKTPSDVKVFDPPTLERASTLRPDVLARIELLKIVWRPDRSAADAVNVCEELEKYLSGTR